ncbi:aromatic acid exporter family protein [Arthrobacter sp. NPDC090010]|uniref:FUSC family protein n=1 Tax=Arthrobacter sp. NPDC090010 TaxID=3363942 RepID=UPI003803A65A
MARLSSLRKEVKDRATTGAIRTRESLVPALQMTLCAVGAYTFSEFVLGHVGPLFAATSSLIALGFARGTRMRRVLEVGIGCTLGIAVGELLLHWLGSGILQAAAVLLFSILLARFLDGGAIFATQLGLQSLLVVLLPAPAGGPFTRSLDAVVGGTFALLVAFLTPRDPREEPRLELRGLLQQTAEVLRECGKGLMESDSTQAWHALVRARNCQPKLDALRLTLRASDEVTTMSPLYRRHRSEVSRLSDAVEFLDLALRNCRVFARRLTSAINHTALSDEATQSIAEVLLETADAVDVLAAGYAGDDGRGRESALRSARQDLAALATRLHPKLLGVNRLEGETVVMLFRPLMVDLLETAGAEAEEARDYLPEL